MDFYIAVSSIMVVFLVYTWLMLENLKRLRDLKETRLALRRQDRANRPI